MKKSDRKITVELTQAELMLLSDALIAAISRNSEAMSLVVSLSTAKAIRADGKNLRDLNTRLCEYMNEEEK